MYVRRELVEPCQLVGSAPVGSTGGADGAAIVTERKSCSSSSAVIRRGYRSARIATVCFVKCADLPPPLEAHFLGLLFRNSKSGSAALSSSEGRTHLGAPIDVAAAATRQPAGDDALPNSLSLSSSSHCPSMGSWGAFPEPAILMNLENDCGTHTQRIDLQGFGRWFIRTA